MSEQATFQQARKHARAARDEARACLESLLPPAFWQHACASRKEARAAAKAFSRAFKRQCCHRPGNRRPATKQPINIA